MRNPDQSTRMRPIAMVAAVAVVITAGAYIALQGSVVLRDPRNEIASAYVIDGWGQRQKLASVGFAYVVMPKLEGTVEIRCANGNVVRSGYVTPGAPTWQTIGTEVDC